MEDSWENPEDLVTKEGLLLEVRALPQQHHLKGAVFEIASKKGRMTIKLAAMMPISISTMAIVMVGMLAPAGRISQESEKDGMPRTLRIRLRCRIRIFHKYQSGDRATSMTERSQHLGPCHSCPDKPYTKPSKISPMSSETSGRLCLIVLRAGSGVAMMRTLVMMLAAAV